MSDALFRPGELESPGSHCVARDLRRGVLSVLRSNNAEVERWGKRLALPPSAVRYLAVLIGLPRSKKRPFGVGLQVRATERDELMGLTTARGEESSQGYDVRRLLQERGLISTYRPLRSVAALTAARKPEHRRNHFITFAGRRPIEHTQANVVAIDYPTPRALDLLRARLKTRKVKPPRDLVRARLHPRKQRPARDLSGLWKTLWSWLQVRCERFVRCAKRPSENRTPDNEGECEGATRGRPVGALPSKTGNPARVARARGEAARTGDPPTADFEHSRGLPACGKLPPRRQPPRRTRYADGRSRKAGPLPASGSYGGWSLPPPATLRASIAFHERRMRSSQLIPGEYERHKESVYELRRELWRRKAVIKRLNRKGRE